MFQNFYQQGSSARRSGSASGGDGASRSSQVDDGGSSGEPGSGCSISMVVSLSGEADIEHGVNTNRGDGDGDTSNFIGLLLALRSCSTDRRTISSSLSLQLVLFNLKIIIII